MPVGPPVPPAPKPEQPGGSTSFKAQDIIRQAMIELGVLDPNEQPQAGEIDTGLTKLNRMIDAWNADGLNIYAINSVQYNITPNLQPHTIGPDNATFAVDQRPVEIEEANIILNAGPSLIRKPLNLRDYQWWANKPAYAVTATLPMDLYYQPAWPNGNLFLWPVPTVAYLLELFTWTIISQVQLEDSVSLPPGYLDAIVYSLAEALGPSFQQAISGDLAKLALTARMRIQRPNSGAGMLDLTVPVGVKGRSYFNYVTGMTN